MCKANLPYQTLPIVGYFTRGDFFVNPLHSHEAIRLEHFVMNGCMHVRFLWRNVRASLALIATLAGECCSKSVCNTRAGEARRTLLRPNWISARGESGACALMNRGESRLPVCYAPNELQKPRKITFLFVNFTDLTDAPGQWKPELASPAPSSTFFGMGYFHNVISFLPLLKTFSLSLILSPTIS